MLRYLWSLPKTPWTVRLLAAGMAFLFVSGTMNQWPQLPDDWAVVRWMAWSSLVGTAWFLPGLLVVTLVGRVPGYMQLRRDRLRKTLPQIHRDIAQEQRERRERSRYL